MGECLDNKCVFDTDESREKCFPPQLNECSVCKDAVKCESGFCNDGKCVVSDGDGCLWSVLHGWRL